jgi:hypothetical protein
LTRLTGSGEQNHNSQENFSKDVLAIRKQTVFLRPNYPFGVHLRHFLHELELPAYVAEIEVNGR